MRAADQKRKGDLANCRSKRNTGNYAVFKVTSAQKIGELDHRGCTTCTDNAVHIAKNIAHHKFFGYHNSRRNIL